MTMTYSELTPGSLYKLIHDDLPKEFGVVLFLGEHNYYINARWFLINGKIILLWRLWLERIEFVEIQ